MQAGTAKSQVAKRFTNGRSQAVRLPAAYRFDTKEVFIRRDTETGDVILSRKPATWNDFFAAVESANVPADFLLRRSISRERKIAIRSRNGPNDWHLSCCNCRNPSNQGGRQHIDYSESIAAPWVRQFGTGLRHGVRLSP